jgi:hypothetical protein
MELVRKKVRLRIARPFAFNWKTGDGQADKLIAPSQNTLKPPQIIQSRDFTN